MTELKANDQLLNGIYDVQHAITLGECSPKSISLYVHITGHGGWRHLISAIKEASLRVKCIGTKSSPNNINGDIVIGIPYDPNDLINRSGFLELKGDDRLKEHKHMFERIITNLPINLKYEEIVIELFDGMCLVKDSEGMRLTNFGEYLNSLKRRIDHTGYLFSELSEIIPHDVVGTSTDRHMSPLKTKFATSKRV